MGVKLRFLLYLLERKLFELLKRVQNRQYDDQRGTSLTAFKEMPDFLRASSDKQTTDSNTKFTEDEDVESILQHSGIEVCRQQTDSSSAEQDCILEPSIEFLNDESNSILPTNERAEQYFSQTTLLSSPDFSENYDSSNGHLYHAGLQSPGRSDDSGWTLTGQVEICRHSRTNTVMSETPPMSHSSSLVGDDLNVCLTEVHPDCDGDSKCSTPSPRTHDLLFDNHQESDDGQVFGVV